jgi:transcription termination factor Rho
MELLIDKLSKTKSNADFLSAMQKMGYGADQFCT